MQFHKEPALKDETRRQLHYVQLPNGDRFGKIESSPEQDRVHAVLECAATGMALTGPDARFPQAYKALYGTAACHPRGSGRSDKMLEFHSRIVLDEDSVHNVYEGMELNRTNAGDRLVCAA